MYSDRWALKAGLPTVTPSSRARVAKELVTVREVAETLGVRRQTVYRWLDGTRRPSRKMLKVIDVLRWLRQHSAA